MVAKPCRVVRPDVREAKGRFRYQGAQAKSVQDDVAYQKYLRHKSALSEQAQVLLECQTFGFSPADTARIVKLAAAAAPQTADAWAAALDKRAADWQSLLGQLGQQLRPLLPLALNPTPAHLLANMAMRPHTAVEYGDALLGAPLFSAVPRKLGLQSSMPRPDETGLGYMLRRSPLAALRLRKPLPFNPQTHGPTGPVKAAALPLLARFGPAAARFGGSLFGRAAPVAARAVPLGEAATGVTSAALPKTWQALAQHGAARAYGTAANPITATAVPTLFGRAAGAARGALGMAGRAAKATPGVVGRQAKFMAPWLAADAGMQMLLPQPAAGGAADATQAAGAAAPAAGGMPTQWQDLAGHVGNWWQGLSPEQKMMLGAGGLGTLAALGYGGAGGSGGLPLALLLGGGTALMGGRTGLFGPDLQRMLGGAAPTGVPAGTPAGAPAKPAMPGVTPEHIRRAIGLPQQQFNTTLESLSQISPELGQMVNQVRRWGSVPLVDRYVAQRVSQQLGISPEEAQMLVRRIASAPSNATLARRPDVQFTVLGKPVVNPAQA